MKLKIIKKHEKLKLLKIYVHKNFHVYLLDH